MPEKPELQFYFKVSDIAPADQDFYYRELTILLGVGKSAQIAKNLHEQFKIAKFDINYIKKYYNTFWRYYVIATWRDFLALDPNMIAEALPRQLGSAYTFGLDVEGSILSYLLERSVTYEELNKNFTDFSKAISSVVFPLNPSVDQSITLQEAEKDYRKYYKEDSVGRAEFLSKIEKIIYPTGSVYAQIEPETRISNTTACLDLLVFFSPTTDIEAAIADYMQNLWDPIELKQLDPLTLVQGTGLEGLFTNEPPPPPYEGIDEDIAEIDAIIEERKQKEGVDIEQKITENVGIEQVTEDNGQDKKSEPKVLKEGKAETIEESKEVEETEVPTAKEAKASTAPKNQTPVKSIPPPTKPQAPKPVTKKPFDYSVIKKQIEAKFAYGAAGQFEDLDAVLRGLEALANKFGDEKIKELYYFDESQGKFVWDKDLLGK